MQIKHLELATSDLNAVENFYSRTLGLKIVETSNELVTFAAGSSTLTFKESEESKPFYHFAFNIPSNKVDEALEMLKGKVEILPLSDAVVIAEYVNWNARAFYFHDSVGNIVEFIARFDLNIHSNEPFSANSIVNISEIGLVVDNVFAATEEITSNYHLPIFNKQPRLENFTAIGDDEGLFIVVDKKKNWYPTEIRAKFFPLKASIFNGIDTFEYKVNASDKF